ncbi:unnamed protein product [Caenorhabditis angaria]|uniref:Uncharacterized protein n=1 Tax=Caenorhabditis angaria TaxID=860376 RepID=A0A9P1IMC3_9PELO|nr:unnamed protein product [Caenorhabditis angaria]
MDVNQNHEKELICSSPNLEEGELEEEEEDDNDEEKKEMGIMEQQKISGIPMWAFRRFYEKPEKYECNIGSLTIRKVGNQILMKFGWEDRDYQCEIDDSWNRDDLCCRIKENDEFRVKLEPIYHKLRAKLECLPQCLLIDRIQIENSESEKLEDTILEVSFFKKWKCQSLEYTITKPFDGSYVLYRLVTSFKPAELLVQLQYGQHYFHKSGYSVKENHFHIFTEHGFISGLESDTTKLLEKCTDPISNPNFLSETNLEYEGYLREIGFAMNFGRLFRMTIEEMKKFMKLLMTANYSNHGILKKFLLKCPSGDVDCVAFKKQWTEEKLQKFEENEKTFVCIQNYTKIPENSKFSLSFEVSKYVFPLDDRQFLNFTKKVPFLNIAFRVDVTDEAVVELINDWFLGNREIEEIRLRLKNRIGDDLSDKIPTGISDQKWIKVRRNRKNQKSTLYICKESLSHRVLYIKYQVK